MSDGDCMKELYIMKAAVRCCIAAFHVRICGKMACIAEWKLREAISLLPCKASYPALFAGSKAAKNASISAPESDSQSSSFCVSAVSHSA